MDNISSNNNLGTQTFLASTSTVYSGVVKVADILLYTINDGSIKWEYKTVPIDNNESKNKISEAIFGVPDDQLIIDALTQLQIDNKVEPGDYFIQDTEYFEVPNTIKKQYIINGTIIDFYKGVPLEGADLILPLLGTKFKTKTDKNGKYNIKATYPVDKNTLVPTFRPSILVTAQGYLPKKIKPYALDQTVREDLRTIQLKSVQGEIDKVKSQVGKLTKDVVKQVQNLKPSKAGLKKLVKKFIKIIRERLLPFLLTLLSKFFISKISDIIDGKLSALEGVGECPSPEEVTRLRAQRNRIVRELNNIYKVVDIALKVVGILGGTALILRVAAGIIQAIPLPTSVPPGAGIPTSVILGFQAKIKAIEKIAETVFTLSIGLSAILLVLSALLLQALKLLKLLDWAIERCSDGEDLVAIDFETALIDEAAAPTPDLVNGFKLGIVTDNKTPVGSLKRRYATATNSQGVVVLKGEPSFSASEQILKDELAFYIRSNNLKAN